MNIRNCLDLQKALGNTPSRPSPVREWLAITRIQGSSTMTQPKVDFRHLDFRAVAKITPIPRLKCLPCEGVGHFDHYQDCDRCSGTGVGYVFRGECFSCHGTGHRFRTADCQRCQGTGVYTRQYECNACRGTKRILIRRESCRNCSGVGGFSLADAVVSFAVPSDTDWLAQLLVVRLGRADLEETQSALGILEELRTAYKDLAKNLSRQNELFPTTLKTRLKDAGERLKEKLTQQEEAVRQRREEEELALRVQQEERRRQAEVSHAEAIQSEAERLAMLQTTRETHERYIREMRMLGIEPE